MNVSIVTGVGYGDEGKGVTTKWLCEQLLSGNDDVHVMVVRFGGGNQVGHTTMVDDFIHTHHHTGAGTLVNVPTFYSRFCTVDPINTVSEIEFLTQKGFTPRNMYDPRCMIVTPLDVIYNRMRHAKTQHGSVGVGFGATIARNESHYRLYVADIATREIFIQKCKGIQQYYNSLGVDFDLDCEAFYIDCINFLDIVEVSNLNLEITRYIGSKSSHIVFEGHQGVLLDQEYGVFPHVTRSKTTCKNAFTILEEENLNGICEHINQFMVTRAYHTRHGNGYFEEEDILLTNTEFETNKFSEHQGAFKTAPLNKALLTRGVLCNLMDESDLGNIKRHLVVTCCDQVESYEDVIEYISETTQLLDTLCINDHPSGNIRLYAKEEKDN
jgi:adenylosuccinate synthase